MVVVWFSSSAYEPTQAGTQVESEERAIHFFPSKICEHRNKYKQSLCNVDPAFASASLF